MELSEILKLRPASADTASVRAAIAKTEAAHAAELARLAEAEQAIAAVLLTATDKTMATMEADASGIRRGVNRLEALLIEMRDSLRRAIEAETEAQRTARMQEALGLAVRLRQHGAALERAAHTIRTAGADLLDAVEALNRLGIRHPPYATARILAGRALGAAVMGGPLQQAHLAPSQRISFGALANGWADSVDQTAAAVLGTAKPPAAEGHKKG